MWHGIVECVFSHKKPFKYATRALSGTTQPVVSFACWFGRTFQRQNGFVTISAYSKWHEVAMTILQPQIQFGKSFRKIWFMVQNVVRNVQKVCRANENPVRTATGPRSLMGKRTVTPIQLKRVWKSARGKDNLEVAMRNFFVSYRTTAYRNIAHALVKYFWNEKLKWRMIFWQPVP